MWIHLYFQSRREYLNECWKNARQHWAVGMVAFASAAYSFITGKMADVDLSPFSFHFTLPKLPLAWAAVIVLAAIAFVAIEGGYRLREAERRTRQTKVVFTLAELAEGLRNYARIRKKEKGDPEMMCVFDKNGLCKILGDQQDQFDVVMEYLEKSGYARKYTKIPGNWFID